MAVITSEPENAISVYEPAKYKVSTISTASLVEKAVVTVRRTSGLTTISILYRDWVRRTGAGPAYSYEFEADISGVLQSILRPISSDRTQQFVLAGSRQTDCTNSYIQYNVKFDFLFRDPATNLLASLGDTATSVNVVAFNVIRPSRYITQEFRNSIYRNGSTLVFQRFLNTPTRDAIPIQLAEHFCLCFITSNQTGYIKIAETLASGSTHTSYLEFAAAGLTDKLVSLNIGPSFLLSLLATDFVGNIPPQFTTTVSFKVSIVNISLQQVSHELPFTVVPSCAGGIRLAWLNETAGVDMYTFDAKVVEGLQSSSEVGIRPNIWPTATEIALPQNKGAFKANSTKFEYYEVETRVLRPDLANYVAQILTSAEVYMIDNTLTIPNNYRAMIVSDGEIIKSDTDEIGMILKFKVYPANQTPTHVQ